MQSDAYLCLFKKLRIPCWFGYRPTTIRLTPDARLHHRVMLTDN